MSDSLNIDTEVAVKYIYESPDGGKTVYRRKIGQSPTERELVSSETINKSIGYSPSEHYYDYDRNDLNRKNPFKDKIIKWILPVQEAKDFDTDETEYFVSFPQDLLEAANLKEGDLVEWVDNNDETYTIRKV